MVISSNGLPINVTLRKIDMELARLFTTVLYSDDIYSNTVKFEFYYTDPFLIGIETQI